MLLKPPFWWYRRKGALGSALAPLGNFYGRIAERRFAQGTPYRSRLPVICIGNFTAGGGGKTPTAVAIMTATTKKHGASPRSFLVVPLVGAFFVDIANAIVLQTFVKVLGG